MERPCLCRARDAARSGRCGRRGVGGRPTTSSPDRRGAALGPRRAAKGSSSESYVFSSGDRAAKTSDLRRLLAKETLARRYYELSLPGICVHVAYLRKPLQYLSTQSSTSSGEKNSAKTSEDVLIGGSKSKEDRVDDFLHFEMLCSELTGGGLEYPIARGDTNVEDDLQVGVDVSPDFLFPERAEEGEGAPEGGGGGLSEEDVGDDGELQEPSEEQKQRIEYESKIPIRIRYQQFTEFTSYTFEMPTLAGYETMKGGFKQGERLIEALKSIDSWWDDIPGELFLVAIVNSKGAQAKKKGDLLYDPLKLQDDLYSIRSESIYPGDSPTGCFVGDQEKRVGIFVNYALQPFTDYLYVAILYDENSTYVEKQQYSRQIQRFLELEEYRLLCLSASAIAKYLFIAIEIINEELLQVLNSFKTTDLSFAERKSALERIIDLQNRSETLGIGIRDRFGASEAYGNVVLRRLDRMNVKPAPGTQNFQGVVRKRLEPALRTYRSAGERLDETTDAVARASNLLRCQIDLDVQEQNDNLLILGTILSVSSFSLAIVQFLEKVDVL